MEHENDFKIGTVCYLTNDLEKQSPMTVMKISNLGIHVVWRDKTDRHLYMAYHKDMLVIKE